MLRTGIFAVLAFVACLFAYRLSLRAQLPRPVLFNISQTAPVLSIAPSKFQALENRVASMEGKLLSVMGRLDAMMPEGHPPDIPDTPTKQGDEATNEKQGEEGETRRPGDEGPTTNSLPSDEGTSSVPIPDNTLAKSNTDSCQHGICVVGPGKAPRWSLPPSSYVGARNPHGRFSGDAKYQHSTGPGRAKCRSPFDIIQVPALPEWVAEAAQASPIYTEIEGRLAAMDVCVEKKRKTYFPKERPCFRCHSVAKTERLVQVHSELIRRLPHCRTICETGFNRGDSALILTTACGKDAHGISFTIDSRWYTSPGRKCLAEGVLNEQRSITFVEGFSTTSINDFFGRNSNHDVKCDVVHVDGGKSETIRKQDLEDLQRVSHKGTLWMTDDVYANCRRGMCTGKRETGHCLFGVFAEFLTSMNISMKCWNSGKATSSSFHVDEAQCYGSANWNTLLQH